MVFTTMYGVYAPPFNQLAAQQAYGGNGGLMHVATSASNSPTHIPQTDVPQTNEKLLLLEEEI